MKTFIKQHFNIFRKQITGTGALLMLLFFLGGCEENITLDLPEYKSKLVVHCLLQPDSLPRLHLSQSRSYFDYTNPVDEVLFLKDALVTITDDQGNKDTLKLHVYRAMDNRTGNMVDHFEYSGSRKTEAGKRYYLFASHAGRQVSAETKVPLTPQITKTEHRQNDDDPYSFILTVWVKDPAGEVNYYKLEGEREMSDPNDPNQRPPAASLYQNPYDYVSDQGYDGRELPLEAQGYFYHATPGDTASVTGILVQASKETGEYFFTVQQQSYTSGDPFSEPVIIEHNITGGLGIFGAFSTPVKFTHRIR